MDRAAPAAATPSRPRHRLRLLLPIAVKARLGACIELSGLKYNIEPNRKSVSGREMSPSPTVLVHSATFCCGQITRNWLSTRFPNIPAYVCNRNAQHNRGNERRSRLLDSTRLCPDMIRYDDVELLGKARHGTVLTPCAPHNNVENCFLYQFHTLRKQFDFIASS